MNKISLAVIGFSLILFLWLWRVRSQDVSYDHDLSTAYGVVEHVGDPKNPHAGQLLIAMRALESGKFEVAESVYREIIKADPKEYLAFHGLGSVLTYEKKYKEAKEYFRASLNINPKFAPSFSGLGAIAAIEENHSEAIELYKKVVELDPKYGLAYWGLGVEYYKKQECETAKKHLRKVPELLPTSFYAGKAQELISRCETKSN